MHVLYPSASDHDIERARIETRALDPALVRDLEEKRAVPIGEAPGRWARGRLPSRQALVDGLREPSPSDFRIASTPSVRAAGPGCRIRVTLGIIAIRGWERCVDRQPARFATPLRLPALPCLPRGAHPRLGQVRGRVSNELHRRPRHVTGMPQWLCRVLEPKHATPTTASVRVEEKSVSCPQQ